MNIYEVVRKRYGNADRFMDRLRDRLHEHDISQGQLARRSGYHATHISRWMNKHVSPQLETMLVLDESCDLLIEEQSEN